MTKEAGVSTFRLYAQLFGEVARAVVERFGVEGEEAIRAGVREFGLKRGARIAAAVREKGLPLDLPNYIGNYDMQRSESFDYENSNLSPDRLEQDFKACPLWETWKEEGLESVGLLYCHEIDGAILKGYNLRGRVEHIFHPSRGDASCRMLYRIEEEDKEGAAIYDHFDGRPNEEG